METTKETTIDTLLGGRFQVEQPAAGYRIAVDTLLLASAVPDLQPHARAVDLGCGVGGVMLAVATRQPQAKITGVELQIDMAALCAANIKRNHFEERLDVLNSDLRNLPAVMQGRYDVVMMNPPYHEETRHTVSPEKNKRLANAESAQADLSVWLSCAAGLLKEDGVMVMIHRGDRLDEILQLARPLFASLLVIPICSKKDAPPKRIILQAFKTDPRFAKEGGVKIAPPFRLYGDDGRYSQAGEAILRGGEGIGCIAHLK